MCEPVAPLVKETACGNCEIMTYDLVKLYEDKICLQKLEEYGVKRIPAIAVNGKLLNCCQNNAITKEDLISAGIGQA